MIGVVPAVERRRRARLFDALEDAYAVRFEGREQDTLRALDAVIWFPDADRTHGPPPVNLPSLRFEAEERPRDVLLNLDLAQHPLLARPLWNARLSEGHAAYTPGGEGVPGDTTLAAIGRTPVWRLTPGPAPHHVVALAPAELGPGDALRSRLAPGRSLALLSLVQFIRNLTGDRDWQTPGLRAAFVIDDPNLRRPTYGHINYLELVASSAEHGYHTSVAMVPLDGRAYHPGAVRLFRENPQYLSLCIHGNNHLRDELRAPRSPAEGHVPAAQAILRSLGFERRSGLTVDRVMVPPHERLGEAATAALFACGFEGFASTRPYPWLDYAHDLSWLSRPADTGPLVGWRSAELVGDGLLALLRVDFRHPREELVIRAFLGQPIIMYGHDDLLRGGPGELERAVAEVGRLGDVRWQSLGEIARSSLATRRRGATLEVRMLSRRVVVDVPDGVAELLVRGPSAGCVAPHVVSGAARPAPGAEGRTGTRLAVTAPGRVELELPHQVDPFSVPLPNPSLRSLIRRMAAEGRDRTRSKLVWASR